MGVSRVLDPTGAIETGLICARGPALTVRSLASGILYLIDRRAGVNSLLRAIYSMTPEGATTGYVMPAILFPFERLDRVNVKSKGKQQ